MLGNLGGRMGLFLLVLSTIGCDRVTKHVASTYLAGSPGRSYFSDTVWIGYVENQGGFLSLGASLPPGVRMIVFTLLTGVMLAVMTAYAVRQTHAGWPLIGLAFFIAGGVSNWIDRLVRGSVVDFLNVGVGPIRTGVFNVADVAILAGAVLFIAGELKRRPNLPEHGVEATATGTGTGTGTGVERPGT
jgi:signal peptidase II